MTDEQQTILLAEADVAVRRSAQSLLKARNFKVAPATDFESAQKLLATQSFDLAVVGTDLGAGPGGFVLLRSLRAASEDRPVIMIAANDELEDVLAAFRLGAADVVLKPLRPSELMAVINRALGVAANVAAVQSGMNPAVTDSQETVDG